MWLGVLSRVVKRTTTFSPKWPSLRAPISTQSPQYKRFLAISEELQGRSEELPRFTNPIDSCGVPNFVPKAGLTPADHAWLQEFPSQDFSIAMKYLKERFTGLLPENGDLRPDFTVSAWLATHILYHKAQSDQEILSAAALVEQYASIVPPPHSHAIIVLAVARLAEHQLTGAMRPFFWIFRSSSPLPSEAYCNLLLRALTLHPGCRETTFLSVAFLKLMESQNLKVSDETYDALLHPRFTSLPIADAVQSKMSLEGVSPSMGQLQLLYQLMMRHRRKRTARRISHAIEDLQRNHAEYSMADSELKIQVPSTKSTRRMSKAVGILRNLLNPRLEDQASHRRRSRIAAGQNNVKLYGDDWATLLRVASRSKSVGSDVLSEAFIEAVTAHPGNLAGYAVVVNGLLHKRDYARAVFLWDKCRPYWEARMDTASLGIGVDALTSGCEPHRAFTLLEQVHTDRSKWLTQSSSSESLPRSSRRKRPAEVNLSAVNQFMHALTRLGRPDATFALWDRMYPLYGLSPDVYTFNILLNAARWSKKYEDTILGQLAHYGLARQPIRPEDPTLGERERAAAHLYAILNPHRKPRITGQWHGIPAPQMALRVAVECFLGNWPFLRGVTSPTRALRRSRDDIAFSPMSDVLNSVTGRGPGSDDGISPLLTLIPPDFSSSPYPHIMPADVTFRALIDLVSAEGLHTEIPLILAWMRALRIPPSKMTLATALVHWVDVSMDAPLIERIKRGVGRDPYAMLMAWMEDWVGKAGMPGREMMSLQMRRKAFYTDSRYLDIIAERNQKVAEALEALRAQR